MIIPKNIVSGLAQNVITPCCKECVIPMEYKPDQCNNGECPCHQVKRHIDIPPEFFNDMDGHPPTKEYLASLSTPQEQVLSLEEVSKIDLEKLAERFETEFTDEATIEKGLYTQIWKEEATPHKVLDFFLSHLASLSNNNK